MPWRLHWSLLLSSFVKQILKCTVAKFTFQTLWNVHTFRIMLQNLWKNTHEVFFSNNYRLHKGAASYGIKWFWSWCAPSEVSNHAVFYDKKKCIWYLIVGKQNQGTYLFIGFWLYNYIYKYFKYFELTVNFSYPLSGILAENTFNFLLFSLKISLKVLPCFSETVL